MQSWQASRSKWDIKVPVHFFRHDFVFLVVVKLQFHTFTQYENKIAKK